MTSTSRRLDDFYDFDDDRVKQHPWYTHTLLIILSLLVLFIMAYGAYQAYTSRQCASLIAVAKDSTQDLVDTCTDTDGVDVETAFASPKKSGSPPWTSTNLEMAAPRPQNHNDYVNMPYEEGVST
jgi:hypothetical protein